jgi:tetrahydromethanopterin S-methyltransferase subunit G
MSKPEPAVGESRAEVGKEIGRDLLIKAVVAVMLIGCILVGGVIGAQVNNDTAALAGGAIGLAVGIPTAILIGARLRRHLQ